MPAPVIVDIYAAASYTGQRPGTIRQWLHRGQLSHRGHDGRGRSLIELRELLRHIEQQPSPEPLDQQADLL